ncbi:MAG TPA: hypothetical protein PLZ20_15205, partial [Nitrospira sp.]|nr:hypothetical protein [Nitrospira sp.]
MKRKSKIRGGMDRRMMSPVTATHRDASSSLKLAAGGLLVAASVTFVTIGAADELQSIQGASALSPAQEMRQGADLF